jgi:hypothetical protein
MMNGTVVPKIRREVSLVEKQDGVAVAADKPVACDCCGKLCTVRFYEMTNGARFGRECANVFDLTVKMTQWAPQNFTRDFLFTFVRANKKQLAYMGL